MNVRRRSADTMNLLTAPGRGKGLTTAREKRMETTLNKSPFFGVLPWIVQTKSYQARPTVSGYIHLNP